ncbi:MAG: Nif3-like dinuclear metal center hexameric protein [Defluviitaleaceae bacterium]|nr:Nif3-like dinuclear metal center hexameric protein [Defluviitaleaceae bacterium]MCL2263033.1 Nif3-like dinuclear metal center hexameric protein [Defluviitaleaceae bacterium]
MHTAQWIVEQFEEWAPQADAEEWDNVGLLVGDAAQEVRKVLVALDATEAVIEEAVQGGFDFIICHHPMVYNPIKRVTTADSIGRKIIKLVRNGIGCYCAHTNLDKAAGGVNDCLAQKIGLANLSPLIPENDCGVGIGRVGFLPQKITAGAFYAALKETLGIDAIRFCGDKEKFVQKIGICGGDGSGARYVQAAINCGCDAYVTGDLRYHCVQDALESGIAMIDITHYGGEIFVLDEIVKRLKTAAKNSFEIFPSSIGGQVFGHM